MPRIAVLSDILASQVAAGEVVERPASVIKELVENAIDAGATEVLVEIRRGGAALIRVTDDGSGMSQTDALLSLERHATSKLQDVEGLRRIMTLGFRGEAIPSIASVSRFRLTTREQNEISGTEIMVEGGVVKTVKDAGCAEGTTVEVRDLFFNLPARRKFMRTETTEAAHVEHQLRLHALATPSVRLRFRKDEREVFDLPAGMSRLERVRWMLGSRLGAQVVALKPVERESLSVAGFVLAAAHARKGRRHQCVFLNGRPVEDAAISRGLTEGFRGELVAGLHPAAWIWLSLDPDLVDVNVHPAKREIRLHRPHELRLAIEEAVRGGLAPAAELPPAKPETPSEITGDQFKTAMEWPEEVALPEPHLPLAEPVARPKLEPAFRKIGELLGRYAVLESDDGLVLLDPRAARERILYERWLGHDRNAVNSQLLLVPELIELGPREAASLLENREAFSVAGFDLSDFGGGTIQIVALPDFFEHHEVGQFLTLVADDLAEGGWVKIGLPNDQLAKVLARRAALVEPARPREAESILEHLFQCSLPYCAPDGRPTLTEISMRELSRRFQNSGLDS